LSARLAEISYHFFLALLDAEDPDAVQAALEDAAQGARDLAEEKRESASNIEDGFGHPTSMSEELEEIAQTLDGWADEIEFVEVPDLPEPEPEECDECEGSGEDEIACYTCDGTGEVEDDDGKEAICYVCNGFGVDEIACYNCDGTGEVESNEVSEDQMGDWVAEVESACSIVDESPV
jgi:DnaJ-class molecular chaperone